MSISRNTDPFPLRTDQMVEIYRSIGWRIFPCEGKTPRVAGGFHAASNELEQLTRWWRRWPEANIGIPCGQSNGLLVIDVDPRHGGTGSLAALERAYEPLPPTATAETGGADHGTHWYFVTGERALRTRTLAPGIDARAEGAYVIAPPSLHPETNRLYRWLTPPSQVAPAPLWLIELVGYRDVWIQAEQALESTAVPIPEGMRNITLTSYAGTMWRRGMREEAIRAALLAENQCRCQPPLSENEVDTIVGSIRRYVVPPTHGENCTDLGNARRMATMYHDKLRYCAPWKRWLVWDERRWATDQLQEVERFAQLTVLSIRQEARAELDKERQEELLAHAKRCEAVNRLNALRDLAGTQYGIAITPGIFDTDPWLLNCVNGTLDLRTGVLTPSNPYQMFTTLCPTPYLADAPRPERWLRFLAQIFPDETIRSWLHRILGYCLTGSTQEQCFWLLWGGGANGKSTFLLTLQHLLGSDYAATAAPTLFLQRQTGQATNDIAAIRGLRMILYPDLPPRSTLDTGLLKCLTGGDLVRARYLYSEYFEFRPQCKIFISTNDKPQLYDASDALWRRLRLIPFLHVIPERERLPDYHAQLLEEAPGILSWLVEGCLLWQREKGSVASTPASVLGATAAYRTDSDFLSQFLSETTREQLGHRLRFPDLVTLFHGWTLAQGLAARRYNRTWLKDALIRAGYIFSVDHGVTHVVDLALLQSAATRTTVLDLSLN